MKFIKRNESIKFNNKLIAELSQQYNLSDDIIKIIISKGYSTKKEITKFLQPQNFKYYNPHDLSGLTQATRIIEKAISQNQRITILGDYDTDGICATAIMYKYFEYVNVKVDYFLPNRFVDGYGLTIDTINKIIDLYNPDLLITVDCGISSYTEIEYAKSKGLTVIVTDHHEIPENIPNCVVVDPKLPNQKYPFAELCGAGVALKLVQALAGYKFANTLTPIAAFATVADIVPLIDENRAIVYNGLANYKNLPIGVLKLMEAFKLQSLQASDISLKIAPKINTAGRMGDANIAFRLFVDTEPSIIKKQINTLLKLNEVRVSDGAEIYEDVMEMLATKNISKLSAIVLYKENWNGGVLGIVCAKLVEKFNRPVCLLSKVENEYKGSVRSIEKIDIYKELSAVSDILIRFGGHSQAGGLSIKEEFLPEFVQRLNNNLANNYGQEVFEQSRYYDIDLNKIDLNTEFLKQLSQLEPFGFGNEKPVFKFTFNNAKISQMKNYPQHIKIKINNLDIVAWNMGEFTEHLNTNSNKDVLLEINNQSTYGNGSSINAVVKGLIVNKLNTNVKADYVNANILKQLTLLNNIAKNKYNTYSENEMQTLLEKTLFTSHFGTLIVTNNFDNYTNFINKYSEHLINYELFNIKNKTGENAILYLPSSNISISTYSNVLFLEPVLCEQYLNGITNANISIINNQNFNIFHALNNISTDRSVFGIYHTAIKNLSANKVVALNQNEYFIKLCKLNPQFKNLKFDQFIFVVMVLSDLDILRVSDNSLNEYTILVSEQKSQLQNSSIYNFVNFNNKLN